MKKLGDILRCLKNKKFIQKFERNTKNYDGNTLLATSDYLNAYIDIILYKK